MAKKVTKNIFGTNDIFSALSTAAKKTGITIDDGKKRSYISTGIYCVNAVISRSIFGGCPANRSLVLFGEPGVGKSFILFNILRNAVKDDYTCIFVDTENSIEETELEANGINVSKVKILRINKVEDAIMTLAPFFEDLINKKKEGLEIGKIALFIDSVSNFSSIKEIDDSVENKIKQDMTRNKGIKKLLRIVNGYLAELKGPMIITGQVYNDINSFVPKMVVNGGPAVIYIPSIAIGLTKAKHETGTEDELSSSDAVRITLTAKKNRLAVPKKIKMLLDYKKGVNPYYFLDFWCTKENYEKVGIVQAKVTTENGKTKFEASKQWYVRHLDKMIVEKQLFNSKVFTQSVLEALEPIISEYFKYSSYDEQQKFEEEFDTEVSNLDDVDDSDFNLDNPSDDAKLFDK